MNCLLSLTLEDNSLSSYIFSELRASKTESLTMSALLLNQLPTSPLVTNSTPPSSPTVQSRSKNMTLPLPSARSTLSALPAACPMSKSGLHQATKNANGNGAATSSKAENKANKPSRRGKLGPGCSLIDWSRLCRSKKDLGCNGGKPRPVTEDELAQHNSPSDAWTAIRGMRRVGNVVRAQHVAMRIKCVH